MGGESGLLLGADMFPLQYTVPLPLQLRSPIEKMPFAFISHSFVMSHFCTQKYSLSINVVISAPSVLVTWRSHRTSTCGTVMTSSAWQDAVRVFCHVRRRGRSSRCDMSYRRLAFLIKVAKFSNVHCQHVLPALQS
ncbi:hypothetical protein LR68_01877 [Anoxybacillus sp. BCO1]|nr:hypothetical protein LR68_01877 [Anoxybacillus sp. BCO1]